MRRAHFEIGLEREYALYTRIDDAVALVLANDRLVEAFAQAAGDRWARMRDLGWRLAPEYSRCLVEISSPPHLRSEWSELLAGFAQLEGWLAEAAASLGIECTAAYSFRTDRFVTWEGRAVTRYAELLLDPDDKNLLLGSPDDVPPCFAGAAPERGYAAFTSTNATVHPPGDVDEARYFWRLLRVARQIEVAHPQRHAFLRDGRVPVAPDPDLSIRDALIRWGEPQTARLLEALPDRDDARFRAIVESSDRPYSCKPRVADDTMLFELRCFHSGLPLANLAPLLDVEP